MTASRRHRFPPKSGVLDALCACHVPEFGEGAYSLTSTGVFGRLLPMERKTTGVEVACELLDVGIRLLETRYRRELPDATDDEIAALVHAWLLDRPGAPLGDSEGVARPVDSIA